MVEDEAKDKALSFERKAPSQGKVALRKAAGVASMIVGLPNLIFSVIAIVASIVGIVFAAVMLVALLLKDTGGDACVGLIVALLIILAIAVIIFLVIVLLLAIVLALAVSGQTLGGLMAFRGRRFGGSVALLMIGSVVSSLFGILLTVAGIFGDLSTELRVVMVMFGLYDLFASFVTGASAVIVMTTKATFRKPAKKKKKEKGSKKKGK